MSSIAITGGATGTGVFSLLAPSTSTNRTLTLPDVSGTVITNTAGVVTQTMLASGVAGNGPTFSASKPTGVDQTVSANVWTKVNYPTEEWDTGSCYDTSLSRFTPNVAGYYQVSASVWNTSDRLELRLYKNGAVWKQLGSAAVATTSVRNTQGSALVYCNGSTDYVEIYASTSTTSIYTSADYIFFQAAMVRAA